MSRSKRMSRRGFTLVELLVVITILAILMAILLPAVFRAQQWFYGVMCQEQVDRVKNACISYSQQFSGNFPGLLEDPDLVNPGGTPSKLSGAQVLRLALLGYARSGNTYEMRYRGPTMKEDDGPERHISLYNPQPGELLAHDQVQWRDGSKDSAYGSIEVLVDYRLTPPRPLLYYRAVKPGEYLFSHNEVYCTRGGETAGSGKWAELTQWGAKSTSGFLLISAGQDRHYLSGDDYNNLGQ